MLPSLRIISACEVRDLERVDDGLLRLLEAEAGLEQRGVERRRALTAAAARRPRAAPPRAARPARPPARDRATRSRDGPISRPNTRSARVITGPSDSAAARSTTLRISRTLPGHAWLDHRGHRVLRPRHRHAAARARHRAGSDSRALGMSSRRSRIGGSSTWTTDSRKYRSSRNVPLLTSSRRSRFVAASTRTSTL